MTSTLAALLKATYGVETTYNINPLVYLVLTTTRRVLNFNPNRLSLVMVNSGPNDITVGPRNDIAANLGIVLVKNGGSLSLTWDRDFELVSSEWFAIASGANSNCYSVEVIAL